MSRQGISATECRSLCNTHLAPRPMVTKEMTNEAGLIHGMAVAPSRLTQTASIGEPQQPVRKQPAPARRPVQVMPPIAAAAPDRVRSRHHRWIAQTANDPALAMDRPNQMSPLLTYVSGHCGVAVGTATQRFCSEFELGQRAYQPAWIPSTARNPNVGQSTISMRLMALIAGEAPCPMRRIPVSLPHPPPARGRSLDCRVRGQDLAQTIVPAR